MPRRAWVDVAQPRLAQAESCGYGDMIDAFRRILNAAGAAQRVKCVTEDVVVSARRS